MVNAATIKTKIVKPKDSQEKSLRIPHALRNIRIKVDGKDRKLNGSELKALAATFTFSSEETTTEFTYSKLYKQYHFSPVSAGRAVRAAIKAQLIERDGGIHNYKLTDGVWQLLNDDAAKKAEKKGKKVEDAQISFLRIENWIYYADFDGRYLTNKEIEVLFYLVSFTNNGQRVFQCSNRFIARGLNCSSRTVNKAVDALKKIGLIEYRVKARNGKILTDFSVKDNFLRNKKKAVMAARKKAIAAAKELDERAAFELYHSENRRRAEARAESMIERANADEQYRLADADMRALEVQVAKAEVFNPSVLDELIRRLKSAKMIRAERLTALQMTEEDLKPRYTCTQCFDTGYLPNGKVCGCYPEGGRRP